MYDTINMKESVENWIKTDLIIRVETPTRTFFMTTYKYKFYNCPYLKSKNVYTLIDAINTLKKNGCKILTVHIVMVKKGLW